MDEGYDAINLARAVALARGEPLEPLPPGALTLARQPRRGRADAGRCRPPTPRASDRRATRDVTDAARGCRGARPSIASPLDARARSASPRSSPSPRSSGSSTCRPAARGTPTRATTCSSCATSCSTGRIPLLGPPTSIGDFHHGVLYYLLLAPAAALSGADPVAVTAWIALGGVAAVAVTGWLARSIGGPDRRARRGAAAGGLGERRRGVDFIWNPNLIALSSSIALAAAWRAWQSAPGRAGGSSPAPRRS